MAKKGKKVAGFFENRSFILIIATIAFFCFSAVLLINLSNKVSEKKAEYARVSEELSMKNEENSRLEQELKNGISEKEKEYIARNELGYILPGERVYADAS